MSARDAELPEEAAGARRFRKVHNTGHRRLVLPLHVVERPRLLRHSEPTPLIDRPHEHFGNAPRELSVRHRLVLVAPLLEQAVELSHVATEEADRVKMAGLFQPMVHRFGHV